MDLEKSTGADLVSNTRRIFRLGETEIRVTDSALICKNPNYSLCDAMLTTGVVYPLEYLLSYWECRSGRSACFVFNNTGCRVSLSCYLGLPERLRNLQRVRDFNVLDVNESLAVTLEDVERIKPCQHGVLTNCVIRKSDGGLAYNIEVVAFGPDSEDEYRALLRDIYVRGVRAPGSRDCFDSVNGRDNRARGVEASGIALSPRVSRKWIGSRRRALLLAGIRYRGLSRHGPGGGTLSSSSTSSLFSDRFGALFARRAPGVYFSVTLLGVLVLLLVVAVVVVVVIVVWSGYSHAPHSKGHP